MASVAGRTLSRRRGRSSRSADRKSGSRRVEAVAAARPRDSGHAVPGTWAGL